MTAGTISCSCTTIPQQIEVTGLEHQVDGRVTNYVRPSTTRRPSLSIVNKLDRRRVLLTTRSATSRGKFFNFRTWNKVPYGSIFIYGMLVVYLDPVEETNLYFV